MTTRGRVFSSKHMQNTKAPFVLLASRATGLRKSFKYEGIPYRNKKSTDVNKFMNIVK